MTQLKTLLIGINDYPSQPLTGCIGDVEKMQQYFQGLKSQFPKGIDQTILTDRDAAKEGIVNALSKKIHSLKKGDTFVMYYSGHGTQEKSVARFKDDHNDVMQCVVPWYRNSDNEFPLLADKEIRFLLNQCSVEAHILAIFDSCHSGDVTREFSGSKIKKRLGIKFPQREYQDFIFSDQIAEDTIRGRYFNQVVPDKNVITLSACQPYESSWEDGEGGVFTRNLISVLSNCKNAINYNDIVRNIEISIRHQTKAKQTPMLSIMGDQVSNQLTSWLKLNGENFKSDSGYMAYNKTENVGWIFSRGELMGITRGSKVTVVDGKNSWDFPVKKVNLNDSVINVPDDVLLDLDTSKTYIVNSIDYLAKPNLFIHNIDYDNEVENELRSTLSSKSGINLVDQWENTDFEINIFNQTLYYSFPNDPYRPLNKQINLLDDNAMEQYLETMDDDLTILAKWHHFYNLEKSDNFTKMPVEVLLETDSGWQDITCGNYTLSPAPNRSENGNHKANYQIKVRNLTNKRLYITPLVLFRGKLEISAYPTNGSSQILEPGSEFQFPNYLQLDHYQEIYNWPFEEACFKFIVSTKSDLGVSVSSATQSGFEEPLTDVVRVMSKTRGGGGERMDPEKEKWGIYTSVVRLPNPSQDQVSGALLKNLELYQENEILSGFIERLYFQLDEKRLSNVPVQIRSDGEKSLKIWMGNTIDTVRRNRLFRKQRKRFPDKPIVVAEGDSWFLYPILVKDTIDYLMESWPVKSLAWAGDTLENYKKSGQLLKTIKSLGPKYVVLSGGGNDIIGEDIKDLLIKNASDISSPRDYLNDKYEERIKSISDLYNYFFSEISKHQSIDKILVHGYDYIRPDHATIVTKDGWLNKYLQEAGIANANERSKLIKFLIDEFNDLLNNLSEQYEKVVYLDMRNVIESDEWYDEIHPNDSGYKKIANSFEKVLNETTL